MKRHGFTLIELLVVISIIAVLMSIMMPALRKAKEQANKITCSSRLKDIGVMMNVYGADNKGNTPTHFGKLATDTQQRWTDKLAPYYNRDKGKGNGGTYDFSIFRCPTQDKYEKIYPNTPASIYGLNYYFLGHPDIKNTQWTMKEVVRPSELPLVGDLSSDEYAGVPVPVGSGTMRFVGYQMNPRYPHPLAFKYGFLGGDISQHRTEFDYYGPAPNHSGRTNYLFADNHSDTLGYWPWEGVHTGAPFHPLRNPLVIKK